MQNRAKNLSLSGLLNSEWVLVGGVFLVMLTLVAIAKIQGFQNRSYLEAPSPFHAPCLVSIQGAVKKPGIYEVGPGTVLKKILKKSSPLPYADLSEIDWDQRVESSMEISIAELSEISVFITGLNSEPIHYVVPVGTRVCDLKNYMNAEEIGICKKNLWKNQRILKSRESIDVRKKLKNLQNNHMSSTIPNRY